jgi:hypothetical protein
MIKVRFEFADGRTVEDEMPADLLPRVGERVIDEDAEYGGIYVIDDISRPFKGGRLQREATVRLDPLY